MNSTLFRTAVGLALVAAALACSDDVVAPTEIESARAPGRARIRNISQIVVLGRNLYIGTDVDVTIGALANGDPSDDLPALLAAIATLQATDYPARARALAQEIAKTRPHFVGLQEVSNVDIQLPPLGISISLDFLAILQDELQSLGLEYEVAAQVANSSVLLAPIPGSTIQVIDSDAILVDSRRVTVDPPSVVAQSFSTNIGPVAPGINIIRGWVAITAEVDGLSIAVASTHLESGNSDPILAQIRGAQAFELVSSLGAATPAIIIGDMNDVQGSLMYQVIAGAGFQDAWLGSMSHKDGSTCCFLPDLSNHNAHGALSQRIDYIFSRGAVEDAGPLSDVTLLGEGNGDRIRGPVGRIWPSDHAGVLATIPFPR